MPGSSTASTSLQLSLHLQHVYGSFHGHFQRLCCSIGVAHGLYRPPSCLPTTDQRSYWPAGEAEGL